MTIAMGRAAAMAVVALAIVGAPAAYAEGDKVTPVRSEKLPNVPGKSLTAVVVNYAPGGKSASHHHAGSVFVYVLSGSIRSENSATGPARVYKAGETFFEPPGSEHLVSENASTTEPASLLAVFVADDGAQLTTFDKK
ncbi:cupin domain-containing protein [Bradyrhizobium sp. 190]|uniref:cupin domain-containing protein n=1 Tax=Bradyrhizobium sp. 190 TaxID=2782658 RepID=UPI001FF71CC5|nr:cupin domain-containing protein [Bradyrhizobium sp. 190]MCK1513383.1 cupin domain-containing protein [Bradyrhizobium sp. 190]